MEIAKTVAKIEEYSGDSVRKKIQQRHLMAATVATQSQKNKTATVLIHPAEVEQRYYTGGVGSQVVLGAKLRHLVVESFIACGHF